MKKNDKAARIFLVVAMLFALTMIIAIASQAADILSNVSTGGGALGSVSACSHNSTKTVVEQTNLVNHKKVTTCNDCSTVTGTVLASHEWSTGAASSCIVCGQTCRHATKITSCVSNGDGTHEINAVCEICRYSQTINAAASCTITLAACTDCDYGCAHTDTETVDGETLCNTCGNKLSKATIMWAYGNGTADSVYYVNGQTWADLLRNDTSISGMYVLRNENVSFAETYPKLYRTADASCSAYLFYDGKKVTSTDKIISGTTYYIGINQQFKNLVIDDQYFGYEEGWTWSDICRMDTVWWGDVFALNVNGYVCFTSDGSLILQDGTPVKGTDLIDGSLTYTTE